MWKCVSSALRPTRRTLCKTCVRSTMLRSNIFVVQDNLNYPYPRGVLRSVTPRGRPFALARQFDLQLYPKERDRRLTWPRLSCGAVNPVYLERRIADVDTLCTKKVLASTSRRNQERQRCTGDLHRLMREFNCNGTIRTFKKLIERPLSSFDVKKMSA